MHVGSASLPPLGDEFDQFCRKITDYQDKRRGVLAVLVTLVLKKVADRSQDIRIHQTQLPGGFSGRSLDTKIVTPFMRQHNFPAMAESGWLTRSFEQSAPFTLDYQGNITPQTVKDAFLGILDLVERESVNAQDALRQIMVGLVSFREKNTNIVLARPIHLTVNEIVRAINSHYSSGLSGSARLPVLAVYAVMKLLINELDRYESCDLLPIEDHTASDMRSGLIGDVNIRSASGLIHEGFEIKHDIAITPEIIDVSFEKFRTTPVERYYILTTHPSGSNTDESVDEKIREVKQTHGCQLIVNGVDPTLKYYLRLVTSTPGYISEYVSEIERDPVVSYELKQKWNEVVGM